MPGSESTSPPHKRSKLAHENNVEVSEFDDVLEQGINGDLQSGSLAYEPQFVYGQPDLTSDAQSEEQPTKISLHNSILPQTNDVKPNVDSSDDNVQITEATSQIHASSSLLAVPNLDKEFDSPIKEIKFSFPSDDIEANQSTDQPYTDAAVSDQTDGHSGLTNSADNIRDTAVQSKVISINVADQSVVCWRQFF